MPSAKMNDKNQCTGKCELGVARTQYLKSFESATAAEKKKVKLEFKRNEKICVKELKNSLSQHFGKISVGAVKYVDEIGYIFLITAKEAYIRCKCSHEKWEFEIVLKDAYKSEQIKNVTTIFKEMLKKQLNKTLNNWSSL